MMILRGCTSLHCPAEPRQTAALYTLVSAFLRSMSMSSSQCHSMQGQAVMTCQTSLGAGLHESTLAVWGLGSQETFLVV